jgi:hypothetical protein
MKKHDIIEKNFYYVTADMSQKKNIGCIKPGTTQQETVNSRINTIRFHEHGMQLIGFLTIYNTHKARLEALEHEIKADMVDAGFDHYGNDHFKFKFNRKGKRTAQYQIIAAAVLYKAEAYCKAHNLQYEITWVY